MIVVGRGCDKTYCHQHRYQLIILFIYTSVKLNLGYYGSKYTTEKLDKAVRNWDSNNTSIHHYLSAYQSTVTWCQ